jgi:hypothetical protein
VPGMQLIIISRSSYHLQNGSEGNRPCLLPDQTWIVIRAISILEGCQVSGSAREATLQSMDALKSFSMNAEVCRHKSLLDYFEEHQAHSLTPRTPLMDLKKKKRRKVKTTPTKRLQSRERMMSSNDRWRTETTSSQYSRGSGMEKPPSESCSTRYLVKDPDTDRLSSVAPLTKAGGFMVFGHGMRSCPGRIYSEAFS